MAAHDLLSDTEAKEILGIGAADTSKAVPLARAITALSETLASRVGTIVAAGTVVETHDGGCPRVWLRSPAYGTLTQVIEYDGISASTLTAETNTAKPVYGYYLDHTSSVLIRRSDGADGRFATGRGNVVVTYTPGRAASTATVPARYKEAAGIMLKNWWRTYEAGAGRVNEYDVPQASFPTFAVPKAVKDLLADEWRTGSGIGD